MKFKIFNAENGLLEAVVETQQMEELKLEEIVFFNGFNWVTDNTGKLFDYLVGKYLETIDKKKNVFQLNCEPSAFWGNDIQVAGRKVTYRHFSPQSKTDESSWGYWVHPNQVNQELNDTLQTLEPSLLVAIAYGGVDIVKLAKRQLADQGLGKTGQWVGFDKAAEVHGIVEK